MLEASVDPDIEGFDILDWWRVNSSKYRILSQVARDVLAILVSTVASESAFSTGVVSWILSVAHCLPIQLKL